MSALNTPVPGTDHPSQVTAAGTLWGGGRWELRVAGKLEVE